MKKFKRLLIYIIPLLCFLPIYILRDYTPNNELRYVSIVDEALNNGSIVTFSNHGLPYADKPPLYFWLMMLGREFTGDHLLLFMGIINLAIVACIMAVMNQWCFPNANNRKILPPMLTLLTTGLFTGSFLVMRMDILMTLFIVLSLYTFYKMYKGSASKDDEWLFPLYLFLAVFSKGPVGLLIPLISIVLFLLVKKKIKNIVYFFGVRTWGVFLVLCGIWFLGVWLEGGKEYLNNLLFHQTVDRAVNSFHHKEPFYFYILRFWLLAAPWSLFVVAAFIHGIRKKFISGNIKLQFFVVIIVASFLFLSIISSKVDIYLLPVYPFFIYYAFITADRLKQSKFVKAMIWIPVILMCACLPIVLYLEQNTSYTLPYPWLLYISAGILTLISLLAALLLYKNQVAQATGIASAGIIIFVFLNSFQLPAFNKYIGLEEVAKVGQTIGRQYKTMRYYSYGIGRAENMEVYLHLPVNQINSIQTITDENIISKPFILFTSAKEISRNDSLRQFLTNKPRQIVGKYEVYTIN